MSDQDRKVWEAALSHLRTENPIVCRRWFDDLQPLGYAGGAFGVRASSPHHCDYLRRNCLDAFNDALRTVTNQLTPIRFLGPGEPWDGQQNGQARARAAAQDPGETPVRRQAPAFAHAGSERERLGGPDALPINPDYSFENFVPGPNNRLAHAAALAVADKPGHAYNPLFIHGGVGLGKTHLLQAVCISLLEVNPEARIHYVSCDGFMTRFMNAVQSGKMVEFRHAFRDVDMLVIDDIHFLAKRDRTQEEFFHTFNSLYQANKQIILSSDAPPDEIPDLEERLVSRFSWGLVCKVDKPGYETRVEILKRKAQMFGLEIADEVAGEIAHHVDTNIRELEGAVRQLQHTARVFNRPIDMAMAREALGHLMTSAGESAPSIEQIINEVVTYFQIKRTDVLGKRKLRSVALPRQIGMYIARESTGHSLEEIGAHFGGRDHTTVMHAVKKIALARQETPDIERALSTITARLRGH
ncbi:MAG: chromosomal replication initiator protein DnaA [Phycisphaerales bacterium]|nr:chromosomal replication initiator protein DnaA [Planctomycetota bacterium]MCH8508081.1 chromosomal replication initiator protein DnaA [Phycisphaerales bacterium]